MRCLSFIVLLLFLADGLFAQSPHGKSIGQLDCSSCHKSATWKVVRNNMEFNHDLTNFKLEGQHVLVECRSCHNNLVFSYAKTTCFSCHTDIHQNTVGFNCDRCHTPETWIVKDIKLVHQQSRFPIVGVHQSIDCAQCHKGYNNLNFQPIGASCYSCHSANYNNTKNPNHLTAGFSTACESCHSINSKFWTTQNFQHDFFPLTGGHKIDNCFACHKQGSFAGLSKVCVSCHLTNYNNTTNPKHSALGLSTDCQACHTTIAFIPSTFNHSGTGFALIGKHSIISCNSCHSGTPIVSTDCYSCHKTNYNNTANPPHTSLGFGTDCQTCHSTTAWQPATFNHDQQYFPIYSGSHNGKWNTCADCHTVPTNYNVFSCMTGGCHPQASTDNQHGSVQGYIYSAPQCYACHPRGSGGGFNHATSIFPLTGAHISVDCKLCHTTGYPNTPTTCANCHLNNYNAAANPNHKTLALPTDCSSCHTTAPGWQPASFPIHNNYFPLAGAHVTSATCSNCHNGNYNSTPNQCVGCHLTSYNNSQNPKHQPAGISTLCQSCHNSVAWIPSTFDHTATGFSLTGLHLTIQCSSCHIGTTTGLNALCISCHQSNYNNSTNPSHTSLQLATTCETCHTTNAGWQPATFPVHNNYYTLAGAHTSLSCAQCHNGNYLPASVPTDCYSCHTTDYNNTTNPNHQSAQFPHDCQTCHSQTAWSPSTFNHDQLYFPIYSGSHNNRWTLCSQCHQTPTNFAAFTCMSSGCHPQVSTDSNHNGISGYTYTASACYNCHPRGNGGGKLKLQHFKISN